jgi:hypothetical protein
MSFLLAFLAIFRLEKHTSSLEAFSQIAVTLPLGIFGVTYLVSADYGGNNILD